MTLQVEIAFKMGPEDDIRSLIAQSQKRSAVFDLLTNPTNVHVGLT